LLTIPAIRITRGEIGKTLALGHKERFTGLILNHKVADI
jgi:hypothetical protein